MADENDAPPQITAATKRAVFVVPHVSIAPDKIEKLERWIEDTLGSLQVNREAVVKDIEKYRKVLAGKRATAPMRRGLSNLSVPFTIWLAGSTRARLDESIFRVDPVVSIESRHQKDATQALLDSKGLTKFFTHELMSSEGLNGRHAGKRVITEATNFGTGALKVMREPDDVRLGPPQVNGGKPVELRIPGRVRWVDIAIDDLVWWDGYGNNTQRMPYVGHEFDRTWSQMQKWAKLDYYRADAVEAVRHFYSSKIEVNKAASQPAELRTHRVVELYLDYVCNDGELPSGGR